MDGRSSRALRGRLACHCLLLETDSALVLVDTGFGLEDVARPRDRLSRIFLSLLEPDLREEMTAIRQIRRLGFDPADVRHIVLTHLDFDHAGGIEDFPFAAVHLMETERQAAFAQQTLLDRMRYRPKQWASRDNFRAYASGFGEPWFGFDCVREMEGVSSDVLLVPLVGHTLGHAGVAIRQPEGYLFFAGDAYFSAAEMDIKEPHCPLGLRLYQALMEKDRAARLWNQARLRRLVRDHKDEVTVFSAHDSTEFERLSSRPLDEPVPDPRAWGIRPDAVATEAPLYHHPARSH